MYIATSENHLLKIGNDFIELPSRAMTLRPDAWYRATDVVKDASDKVSQWTDLSGNNKHMIQVTYSLQPTWYGNVYSGKPALRFNGHFLRVYFGATYAQPNTIIIVYNHVSVSNPINVVIDGIVTNARHYIDARPNDVEWGGGPGVGVFSGSFEGYGKTFNALYQPVIQTINFNGKQTRILEGKNVVFSANPGTHSLTGITVGARFTNNNFMNGYIAEIMFFNRLLQADERDNIIYNLNSYYAL